MLSDPDLCIQTKELKLSSDEFEATSPVESVVAQKPADWDALWQLNTAFYQAGATEVAMAPW